jgi:isocitrate dehydrogenase
VDVFIESNLKPEALGKDMEAIAQGTAFDLLMIANRGTQVYPATGAITDCVDQWHCRFLIRRENGGAEDKALFELLAKIASKFRWVNAQKLLEFDGAAAFTKVQGQDK